MLLPIRQSFTKKPVKPPTPKADIRAERMSQQEDTEMEHMTFSFSSIPAPDTSSFRKSQATKVAHQYQTYTEAHLLSLTWQGAEPARLADVETLTTIFREKLNFSTETFSIPSMLSHMCLEARIEEFIDSFAGPQSLLVVYYNGHAKLEERLKTYTLFQDP